MELNESARNLIGKGADATLVTLNPDGSPHVVWVALRSTPEGDELVVAHLSGNKKVRNVRNDPRVAIMIASPYGPGQPISLWLSISGTARIAISGTARIVEEGAPELLKDLAQTLSPDVEFVPEGCTARILDPHPHRQGRWRRPLGSLTLGGRCKLGELRGDGLGRFALVKHASPPTCVIKRTRWLR